MYIPARLVRTAPHVLHAGHSALRRAGLGADPWPVLLRPTQQLCLGLHDGCAASCIAPCSTVQPQVFTRLHRPEPPSLVKVLTDGYPRHDATQGANSVGVWPALCARALWSMVQVWIPCAFAVWLPFRFAVISWTVTINGLYIGNGLQPRGSVWGLPRSSAPCSCGVVLHRVFILTDLPYLAAAKACETFSGIGPISRCKTCPHAHVVHAPPPPMCCCG